MHRTLTLATAAFASAMLVAACGRGDETPGAADQQNEPVNQAQDAIGAVVGAASAVTVGATTTEGYVTNAAIGDMYEIESSRMALERSQNAEVRRLAQTIIDDHTRSSNELQALVRGGQVTGATVPAQLDERRRGMIDNLRGATAQDFDDRYLDQQANAHREALLLHEGYSRVGQNEALKAHAAKTAPTIQMHLDMVNRLDRDTAADDPGGANR